MVESSDIYLLILGEEYWDPMPGTDLVPTEEEWTVARNLGRPIVVFEKAGITPGARQEGFIKKAKDYETGAWRHTFTDTADLLSKLQGALAVATEALRPAGSIALAGPISVPWRESGRGVSAGTILETHVVPVEATRPIPAASLDDLRRTIVRTGEDHALFLLGQAIEFDVQETAVEARGQADGRRPEAGVRIERGRTVSVWESLPTSRMIGTVLDEAQFGRCVARDIRLAAGLGVLDTPTAAVAIGFNDVSMLGVPNDFGGGMTLPFGFSGGKPAQLEPTDAWPMRSLAVGAEEIGRELVAQLMLRLKRR